MRDRIAIILEELERLSTESVVTDNYIPLLPTEKDDAMCRNWGATLPRHASHRREVRILERICVDAGYFGQNRNAVSRSR